jgi:acetyl esterase
VLAVTLGVASASITMGSPQAVAQQRLTITQDVEYAHPGGESLRLDAFVPAGTGPFPALIALHGGGWVMGDKQEWDNSCRSLAIAGFACFSVNYRLAPEYPYPAAVEDALAAVRWVRDHASEYQVDPTRLGAIGSSAGAHLAAMIGYTGDGSTDTGTRVRVIALWSPVTDVATLLPDRTNINETHSNVHEFLDCDLTDCADRKKEASPVTYVDPSDPPTLVANSTDEQIPLTQAQELSATLKDAGVPEELYVVQGHNHGARLKNQFPTDGNGQTVFDLSIAFIQKWIGEGSPNPTSSGSFEAAPSSKSGAGTLFLIVAAIGVAVVVGLVGVPLLRRRRLR